MTEESVRCDVLIIGAGIAGVIASIEATKAGAGVVLVSKDELGKGTATSLARGVFPTAMDTRKINLPGYDATPGAYLEDDSLVSLCKAEVPRQLDNLINLGAKISKEQSAGGAYLYHAREGKRIHGGALILRRLIEVALDQGVRAVEGCVIAGLLKDDGGRVIGAVGSLSGGAWLSIYSRRVILATGGGAGIYHVNSTAGSIVGDGHALALKAGAPLKNMEFTHFYPVGLRTPTGRYVHCSPPTLMMKNARLINEKGDDIIQRYFGFSLQQGTAIPGIRFEWLPRAVAMEAARGGVFLDLRQAPSESWDRLPAKNLEAIKKTGLDARERPLPFLHMGHAFLGGVSANAGCKTPLDGLYAAGEVIAGYYAGERSWGMLPCCIATGAVAGRTAAADAAGTRDPKTKRAVGDEFKELRTMMARKNGVKPGALRDELKQLFYQHAGPVRSESVLRDGLRKLDAVREQAEKLSCRNGKDIREALEVKSMLLMGEALMQAARKRKESRNGHYRTDFPSRDDAAWLRPIVVSFDEQKRQMKVEVGPQLKYR